MEQARIDLKAMQSGNFKGQRFHGRTLPPLIDAARVISGRPGAPDADKTAKDERNGNRWGMECD